MLAIIVLALLSGCVDLPAEDLFRRGDYAAALAAFEVRSQKQDGEALNYLGVHYYLALGVERDPERAASLFERAAIAGHTGAHRNLGILYLRGLGVKQDRVKAYAWFFAGYEAGDPYAFKYLEFAADYITPNQSMGARRWVVEFLRDART